MPESDTDIPGETGKSLLTEFKLNIAEKLKDAGFRYRFFSVKARHEIAIQIRALRKLRGMKQSDLAKSTGMKQSMVSRIEQADYAGWSFNTLLRTAKALDARLTIKFEPMEDVIREYEERER